MNQDYFIDDQDGYNWVTLSKPLSSYTKEELADQLIKNKKETGTTQKIRIGGKIGAILNTDGCDTPEEFLEKYHAVLDRAGFNSGTVIKEEVKPLTIKPKALSKVSLMDYTQEELAHLIMDDKIKNNDGNEYGIYEHRETIFDSTGCNTIEDFINKYQEEFRKRRIKAQDGTLPPKIEIPVPEAIKDERPSNITKEGVRIITIPLGMVNYTQEQLAHLVMDNKRENEEVGVKVQNGVVFDSIGCKTVEDFINKNADVANRLGIKNDYSDKLSQVGNITDMPIKVNQFKLDENKIEEARVNEGKVVETPVIEVPTLQETAKEDLPTATSLISLLQDMILNKQKNNKNITVNYQGQAISTENCNNIGELIAKYQTSIEKDNKTELTNLLKDREVEKAIFLFNIPRGNYYNGTDEIEQSKLDTIRAKNEEYAKIIANSKQVDFSSSELAYNWLNSIVPYINTHALNLNLGLNVSLDPADKYILDFMASKGYDADLNNSDNFKTYEKYQITKKLNELKEYHFFISDYPKLLQENTNLNSKKTNAMAEITYLEQKVAKGARGIELLEAQLNQLENQNTILETVKLDAQISLLENVIYAKSDNSMLHQNLTKEEEAADKAVVLAVLSHEMGDMQDARALVEALPDDSTIKHEIKEQLDGIDISKMQAVNDPDIIERHELYSKQDKLKNKDKAVETIRGKIKYIEEAVDFVNSKIEELRVQNSLENYGLDNTKSKVEVEKDEIIEEPKEEIVPTIENDTIEPMVEESTPHYDFSLDDEEFDLSIPDMQDTSREFIQIKSFRQISKELYDKINESKIKKVITKAVTKLKENKKAALVYAGFAAAIAIATTSLGGLDRQEAKMDTNVAVETTIDNTESKETNEVVDEEALSANSDAVDVALVNTAEPEYTITLDEASKETLDEILDGKQEVYNSFENAYNATNPVNQESLYMPSWSTAQAGDYYAEKDGVMTKLSTDEAQDYYNHGENLVQSVENDGTVIGYVNIDNSDSGKTM